MFNKSIALAAAAIIAGYAATIGAGSALAHSGGGGMHFYIPRGGGGMGGFHGPMMGGGGNWHGGHNWGWNGGGGNWGWHHHDHDHDNNVFFGGPFLGFGWPYYYDSYAYDDYYPPAYYQPYYQPYSYAYTVGSSHRRWCLDHYRTYDPRTNTYIGSGGQRRFCRS